MVTQSYQCVQNGLLQGLTALSAMGMLPCLNTFLETSILVVSNSTSSMFVQGRVQEIQSQKFPHVHQNHETWLISRAHSSISDGVTYLYELESLLYPMVQVPCP